MNDARRGGLPRPSRRAFLGTVAAAGAAGLVLRPIQASAAPRARALPGSATSRSVIASDRQGFNRRWFASELQAVFVPTTAADVVACLEAAVASHGPNVKVVSGRHCYEDFVYNDSTTAIIDMSALNQAGFDRDHNAFFVDAGCDNWSAYRALLNAFGRTLPDGSCASVGAGGHISGGGYGLLSREHGLSIDHVTAMDIVTWDAITQRATLRHLSDSSADMAERDLFWAARGAGGGNFGIIVRFYFADPPLAPTYASLWTASWNWADVSERGFASLLREYADWVASMPGRQFSLLKLNHVAAGRIDLILQVASRPGADLDRHLAEAGAAVTAAQRRFASAGPIAAGQQHVEHLTFLESIWTLNGNGPNQFGKHKSSYLNGAMPSDQVDAVHHWLHTTPAGVPRSDMAQSLVQVDSYGGAINRHASTSSAVPQRSSLLKLQFQTYWNNASRIGDGDTGHAAAQQEAHLAWIRGLYRDTYAAYGGVPNPAKDPNGLVDGCYYNYPDADLGTHADGRIDEALSLYFRDNYRANARNLVAVKRRWDPTNVFNHAQSIPTT